MVDQVLLQRPDLTQELVVEQIMKLGSETVYDQSHWAQICVDRVNAENHDLAAKIREFRFMDIRPRAASDIEDISQASKLLGHASEKITREVYKRHGEVVDPTKLTE